MPRLFINSIEFELSEGQKIAQTKQVNDLVSLSTRQSNYTTTITLPLTANNVRGMNSLGIVGNNSNVPYQRNACYYYSDSGECFIYNGWAIINSTSKGYNLNIYDGSIDFYKAIENTNLSDLDLTEINHLKTLENVIASFNNETIYKYILADYNGKALYDTNKINIDYLVPSVPVSYLWDKIFDTYGFTYSGSVFNTFNFTNLWMSFPKGLAGLDPDVLYLDNNSSRFPPNFFGTKRRFLSLQDIAFQDSSIFVQDTIHIRVTETGYYRFEVSGELAVNDDLPSGLVVGDFWFCYGKNVNGYSNPDVIPSFIETETWQGDFVVHNLSTTFLVQLNENETITFFVRSQANIDGVFTTWDGTEPSITQPLLVNVSKIQNTNIDFEGALLDFKTKDFVNEIIWRFGLTPYKDKHSNNIEFLTLQEVLQTQNIEDWSDKFNSLDNEKYIYGNYAQENNLVYKYNDVNNDHYDGSILINNENLEDSRNVVQSKIYAPEKQLSYFFEKPSNIYKLFEKEVKEGAEINYKSLDKRFYFMRYDDYYFEDSTIIGSEVLSNEQTTTFVPFESFFKLGFDDIVNDYYEPIYQILNDSQIVELTLFLDEIDVQNIDFKKLYYFKQLSNYYLLNKINNFTEKGLVKCDFIRVKYTPLQLDTNTFPLSLSFADTCFTIDGFEDYTNLSFQFSTDGGLTWTTGATFISSNPSCGYVNVSGFDILFRVINIVGEVVSNTILIPA